MQNSVVLPLALTWFSSHRPHVLSVMSVANDKGDNEMIPGAMHRSPGISLKAEENLS